MSQQARRTVLASEPLFLSLCNGPHSLELTESFTSVLDAQLKTSWQKYTFSLYSSFLFGTRKTHSKFPNGRVLGRNAGEESRVSLPLQCFPACTSKLHSTKQQIKANHCSVFLLFSFTFCRKIETSVNSYNHFQPETKSCHFCKHGQSRHHCSVLQDSKLKVCPALRTTIFLHLCFF